METKPPPIPIPPQKSSKTLYHQAATYSLLAPFVAVGINIFIGAAIYNNPPKTRIEALATAFFSSFILLSGLVFGIISLFGIKRYGKAGILWKAITGILIVVFLILAAIPNFLNAREKARQHYEQLHGQPPP